MSTYDEWIDRIQTCIYLLDDLSYGETIRMNFTRRDICPFFLKQTNVCMAGALRGIATTGHIVERKKK